MRKIVTKIAAGMALAAIVAGSSSNIAFAHHGSSKVIAQTPAPVCYADGSCDVECVCILGVDCDGTAHHTETYHYSGNVHHNGNVHHSRHHH